VKQAASFLRLTIALSLGALTSLSALRAQAQDADEAAPDDTSLGNHQRNVRLDLGFRTQFVRSKGLDPFAGNDAITQVTLGASHAFWTSDRLSLAGAFAFDYGGRSATARSGDAELGLLRFTIAPELRYHLFRVLAVTAKVGPTLTRQAASYGGSLGADVSKTAWKAGFDATAGAALEVFGYASGASRKPRLWLVAEGGYGWSASNRLSLEPNESASVPERLTPLDLGKLSLSGPLLRVTAALSFW
jgi:hypothetical protein